MESIEYNTDLMSYEVRIDSGFVNVNPKNLINHEVFHTHKSMGKLFVTVKSCFGNLY